MKRMLILLLAVLFIGIGTTGYLFHNSKDSFQWDADKARLEHIVYWSGLIEEYHQKTGHYPFQELALQNKSKPVLVRIATEQQRSYMIKGGRSYNPDIDSNYDGTFHEMTVKDFVLEIESKLGHHINEYYDIQKVPFKSSVGYNYFATEKGYLLWGICTTCGVTQITTLLMDGYTPTVNIVSEGMKGEVTKALSRNEMLNYPLFKEWQAKPFKKEGFVRARENETIADSKR
jgi:hypothetical protein